MNDHTRPDPYPERVLRLVRAAAMFCLLLASSAGLAQAQDFRVEGTVRDASGASLPGVSIVEVGTQTGTITDSDGEFVLSVSGPNVQIAFSYIGYATQTVDLAGRSNISITLTEDVALINEVVVTALGIERDEKALTYSVGRVSAERLAEVREPNLANALAGKVAGVVVTKPSTGPAGSSRVVIRGNKSIQGDNQPLYVVDGIPIDNSSPGQAGMWGGVDRGDGISDINPDDIEEISILKGPSAAALYGTRAQNGVVLITTKSGRRGAGAGLGVEYNSNLTFEDALVGFSDYQTEYGQGTRGAKPADAAQAIGTSLSSWGARLDGTPVVQFDGQARPYSLVENKLDQFYGSGLTANNTIALNGGFENTTFRFSASHLGNSAIVPNSGLGRTTLLLRGSSQFGRLTADVKANYIKEEVNNRTNLSDSPGNPNYTIALLPTNVDPATMAPGHVPGNELAELGVATNTFVTNPYWAVNNYVASDDQDRVIGSAQLRYEFLNWLSAHVRAGQDWYTSRQQNMVPYGTRYSTTGSMNEQELRQLERNVDFLVSATPTVSQTFGVNASFGGNRMYRRGERFEVGGSGFVIPGFTSVNNLSAKSSAYNLNEKQINSLYGVLDLSFQDYLFLTGTARNDWSSTLPGDENSYFYPSIGASFVFSDAMSTPSWLSLGKVRASWAQVGGDTDPYQLANTFALLDPLNGSPLGVINESTVPLSDLKPYETTGWEAGIDLRFFGNRLGLDLTYYDQSTVNQIIPLQTPSSSGYNARWINAGEVTNSGVELMLTTTPVSVRSFTWDFDVNFAKNSNTLEQLHPELKTIKLADSRTQRAWISVDEGQPYGVIKGFGYLRDPNGNVVLGSNGLPAIGPVKVLGNGTPDWVAGLSNTFRFKNVSLNSLVHINWGGQIYSATNAAAYSAGLHQNTLEGRAACEAASGGYATPCWTPSGTALLSGVPEYDEAGNVTNYDELTFGPNTAAVYPEAYYGRIGGSIAEEFIYDASFIKLRELQLTYRIPVSLLNRTPLKMATVSLVGRNLLLLYSKVPNMDPEANYTNTNAQGLELAGVPQTRSIGFNLNLRL